MSISHKLHLRQAPIFTLSQEMITSFQVLQMPLIELREWLKSEIEGNPVLEFQENTSNPEIAIDNLPEYNVSLFEYLMGQARLTFFEPEELRQAELIIGNLDEKGFFTETAGADQRILKEIQTFDPPGIAACGLQECLLIQLRFKGKKDTLGYALIKDHFDDLLHYRISTLQKDLKCSRTNLLKAIQELSSLDMHPGYRFRQQPNYTIIPDVLIRKEDEGTWKIEINEEDIPDFKVSRKYLDQLKNPDLGPQERAFLCRYIAAGKWISYILLKRNKTLKELTQYLVKTQDAFLSGKTSFPLPMTMKEIAREIGLHESTIARAVRDKYIASPCGLLPLRSLFTNALKTSAGEDISSQAIKQLLPKLIAEEDKALPHTDADLSHKMKTLGLSCARRTISKYRRLLKIAPASQRKL